MNEKKEYDNATDFQRKLYNTNIKKDTYRIFLIRRIIEKLITKEPKTNNKILDVGCGDGELLYPFINKSDTYGFDIADKLINKAKKKGIKASVLNLESSKFPFSDEFFDIIICSQVIEHIVNTDHLLSEINRVLKKNETLIISFPNINQPASFLIQLIYDLPPVFAARYKSPHVRDFTLKTIKIALKNNGFIVKDVIPTYIFPFNNRISRLIAKIFIRFSHRIILVCQKSRKVKKKYQTIPIMGEDKFEPHQIKI